MNDQGMPINIIIADDHKIFLDGLCSLLKEFDEIKIVGTATNGDEVLQLLEMNSVDIVISDINMPGMDGIKLSKEIKKKYPQIKIIILTMLNDGNIIATMLKNGIAGYILKDTGKDELLFALTTVARGESFFSKEVHSTLVTSMMPDIKSKSNNILVELSERELEILKLIAEENTQQEIADKLFISPHTVIFHRRKLLYKFNVKNTAGLIKAAMDKGFLK